MVGFPLSFVSFQGLFSIVFVKKIKLQKKTCVSSTFMNHEMARWVQLRYFFGNLQRHFGEDDLFLWLTGYTPEN